MKKLILLLYLAIIISAVYLICYFLFKNYPLLWDEAYHYKRIMRFVNGDYAWNLDLAMLPGYHLYLTIIARIIKSSSVPILRFFSLITNLLSIVIVYLINRHLQRSSAISKTLQYAFFPLFFVFYLLLYTDMFSLLSILLAYYALIKGRYGLSGMMGIWSFIVRQTNIFWILFFDLLIYLETIGRKITPALIVSHLSRTMVYNLGFLAIGIFAIWNKGLALTGREYLPLGFNFTNIYLLLFLGFFIFLPLQIANLSKMIKLIKTRPLITVLGLGFLFFYLVTFTNTHSWNQPLTFLRNFILVYFTADIFQKLIFFIPLVISLLSFVVTRLEKPEYYLLYPVTILSLLPVWLVEPRYYFVPFALFLIWRKQDKPRIEMATLLWFIVLAIIYFIVFLTRIIHL